MWSITKEAEKTKHFARVPEWSNNSDKMSTACHLENWSNAMVHIYTFTQPRQQALSVLFLFPENLYAPCH